ncbi:hypothetical protein SODALDRAFT_69768 [Sodiomyces alkalinus F11]|uniref:Uncharacterized protein n=1 Tax=Sodiomyces alkalinus (strain CBS 110278 / VKM F-3762 / F11) TaxID=1314773 RepID=A0A3N2PM10_SODAK|nr:hypothetical protein SODALDRAFT_69768 [Sodiomyces alkalinus F11]ROT35565.1 hypothetical protein SODALDRAFT_69768 [Sodiomyces alkalinus F11]
MSMQWHPSTNKLKTPPPSQICLLSICRASRETCNVKTCQTYPGMLFSSSLLAEFWTLPAPTGPRSPQIPTMIPSLCLKPACPLVPLPVCDRQVSSFSESPPLSPHDYICRSAARVLHTHLGTFHIHQGRLSLLLTLFLRRLIRARAIRHKTEREGKRVRGGKKRNRKKKR